MAQSKGATRQRGPEGSREGPDVAGKGAGFSAGKQTLSGAGVGSRPREQEARSCGGLGASVIRRAVRDTSAGSPSGWRD
jgi:hypothetical protein